jgi:hypothetical protein
MFIKYFTNCFLLSSNKKFEIHPLITSKGKSENLLFLLGKFVLITIVKYYYNSIRDGLPCCILEFQQLIFTELNETMGNAFDFRYPMCHFETTCSKGIDRGFKIQV